jgi:hypothetical protein
MNYEILAPGIFLYKTNPEQVLDILSEIKSTLSTEWQKAQGVNTETNENHISESRSCFDFALNQDSSLSSENLRRLYEKTDNWIQEKINNYANFYSVEKLEKGPYIYLKYENNNKFDWHIDDGKKYPRTVSVSAYLNDDYEGGEIEFNHFNISHKPSAGDIIVFGSSYPYMHRVNPVTSGTRYAVVNWYRYHGYPAEM